MPFIEVIVKRGQQLSELQMCCVDIIHVLCGDHTCGGRVDTRHVMCGHQTCAVWTPNMCCVAKFAILHHFAHHV